MKTSIGREQGLEVLGDILSKSFGQVDLTGDWIVAEDGLINKHNRDLAR